MVYCNMQNYLVIREWDEADWLDPLIPRYLVNDKLLAVYFDLKHMIRQNWSQHGSWYRFKVMVGCPHWFQKNFIEVTNLTCPILVQLSNGRHNCFLLLHLPNQNDTLRNKVIEQFCPTQIIRRIEEKKLLWKCFLGILL